MKRTLLITILMLAVCITALADGAPDLPDTMTSRVSLRSVTTIRSLLTA